MVLRSWITAAVGLPAIALTVAVAAQPASAAPVTALACHAWMSNSHPADYTTTDVQVRTAGYARVTTTAHYKTVNRTYYRTAGAGGRATVPYYISRATPGYRVVVSVHVRKGGRNGSCSTSFTPHA